MSCKNSSCRDLFRFDQQVHGIYATYERPFGDFTALAGLRIEATLIDLNQVTRGLTSDNDYVRAYPSLHVNYRLNEKEQLSASYSRRVQRPNPQDYNAFPIVLDPRNVIQGNPDLKPQQTDSFELGYQYRKGGATYLATGYYRHGQDAVNDVYRDIGGGVILQTKENVGTFQSAGVELVANGRLPKGFSYNLSGNLYWSEIDASDLGFGAGKQSTFTASGRGSVYSTLRVPTRSPWTRRGALCTHWPPCQPGRLRVSSRQVRRARHTAGSTSRGLT